MPFLGKDFRGPGFQWEKSNQATWTIPDRVVNLDAIPRSQVRKVIETYLQQVQQTKHRSSYTSLTSAPVSKCSVKEDMNWLQVGSKSSKEVHGYTTLGELIRRLDLEAAAKHSQRFSYTFRVAEMLIRYKLSSLSGSAQAHVFRLVEALLGHVMETYREIRQMKRLLYNLMVSMQRQSRSRMFSSKTAWFQRIETVRRWQTQLKQIDVPRRVDSNRTLSDMPLEIQHQIISNLTDAEDVGSLAMVNRCLRDLCESEQTWRNLCCSNFTQDQIAKAKDGQLTKKSAASGDNIDDTACTWKEIYFILEKNFTARELHYTQSLLYCRHCSIIYWEDTGHPCIAQPDAQHAQPLSPHELVFYFDT